MDLSVEELEEEINALIASTAKYIHKYKINPILKAYSKYYYQVKEGFVVAEIKTDHSINGRTAANCFKDRRIIFFSG